MNKQFFFFPVAFLISIFKFIKKECNIKFYRKMAPPIFPCTSLSTSGKKFTAKYSAAKLFRELVRNNEIDKSLPPKVIWQLNSVFKRHN